MPLPSTLLTDKKSPSNLSSPGDVGNVEPAMSICLEDDLEKWLGVRGFSRFLRAKRKPDQRAWSLLLMVLCALTDVAQSFYNEGCVSRGA